MTLTQITEKGIKDGEILNADINASAAIARTKLANVDLVDDTSPQLGGNLDTNDHHILVDDNHYVYYGDGEDLKIGHDGTNSYLQNTTGVLYINNTTGSASNLIVKANDNIELQPANGETGVKVIANGATELYHDNSKKLQTNGAGVDVFQNLYLGDSVNLKFGTAADLKIYHDGTDSYIDNENGYLYLNNDSSAIRLKSGNSWANGKMAAFYADGAVELYHNNTKAIETASTGVKVYGGTASANGTVDIYPTGSAVYSILNLHNTSGSTAYNAQLIAGSGQAVYLGSGGTGDVVLRTANSQNKVRGIHNGATELYHSSTKKFETASTGVQIPAASDIRIAAGTWAGEYSGGIKIQADPSNSYFQYQGHLHFRDGSGANKVIITSDGDVAPGGTNSDLGSSSNRWANVYTNDLHLSNEGHSNDVDGSWGNWTIQEGESDLFLKNNRSGKKYKFNLTEVS